MYIQGSTSYNYHVQTYGHPSKVGYKDLIPSFHAAKWDPDYLIDLYIQCGAKYFFSMGVHHDNYDMWNSKYQPRWNSVATGPKKDIVGMWKVAARKRGLYFGVSEHLSNSFDWLSTSHMSDTTGPMTGVPYDGTDSEYSDLYHDISGMPPGFLDLKKTNAMGRVAPDRWKQQYFNRVKDLVDQHQPDLLYTDGGIPFEEYGLGTVAEVYNVSEMTHHGKNQAVYFSKTDKDCQTGTCSLDRERGILDGISPVPWQTDTCIGHWHYERGTKYKSGKNVVDMLVDIVSKNGNLLLNIPLPNSGQPDFVELEIIADITRWMKANSEGIYGTRPWKVYGEGPSTKVAAGGGGFNEGKKPKLGATDIRFTTKGSTIYAYAMGWPTGSFVIESLGLNSPQQPGNVLHVELLGTGQRMMFNQSVNGLTISPPAAKTSDIGYGFKISLA
jgi:alpha-L-fucosidase